MIGVLIMLQACVNQEIVVSIVDPKVLSVEVQETGEEMVNLKDQKEILFGGSPEIPNNTDYTKMRRTVYEKLLEAQKLLPSGLRFCLYEAYRSLSLQKKLFSDRYEKVQQQNPDWSHEQIFRETIKLVSPVINFDGSHNIPPHSTGAAIDIYLVNEKNEIVDMGIKVADWMEDMDGSISKTNSSKISDTARKNRSIMNDALNALGFVNYEGEYWHWSYGDRYWAYQTGQKHAFYDTVK